MDVSKDLAAVTRIFHTAIRLVKSQTTHKVKTAIAKLLEKWLSVQVFPDQLKTSSTAVAQANALPVVSELRNPTTPTNPHSTLTALPLTVEQVVVQLLLDDLARMDKKPDEGLIIADIQTAGVSNTGEAQPLDKKATLEKNTRAVHDDLKASRLTEQRAASELAELRKGTSKQRKVFETELHRANDRRHKARLKEAEA